MYDDGTINDLYSEYATPASDGADAIDAPWTDGYAGGCCEPPPDPCGWGSDPSLGTPVYDAAVYDAADYDAAVYDTPVYDAAVYDTADYDVPAVHPGELPGPADPYASTPAAAVIPAGQPGGPVAIELPSPVETAPGFGPTVMPTAGAFAAEPGPFATTMTMAGAYAAEPSAFATVMPTAPAFDAEPGPFATTYHVATTPPPLANLYARAADDGDLLQQVQILGLMGHDNRMSWLPTSSIF